MVQHLVEETSGDKKKMSALMFNVWKQVIVNILLRVTASFDEHDFEIYHWGV